jgi:thiol-disulfide isomerase/thioredoxin
LLLASCGGPAYEPLEVGNPAPAFSLPRLEGGTFESGSLQGRAVILNFWATWCAPCRTEIPELIALAGEADVNIVGIALDKEGAVKVRPFVEELEIGYPVLLGDEEIFQRFDGFVVPHTVVLDSALIVRKVYRGPVTREMLEQDLRAMVSRP